MTTDEIKIAAAAGALPSELAASIAVFLRETAAEVAEVAEALERAAEALESGEEGITAGALMIGVARRLSEEVLRESGEAFDAAVWAAGLLGAGEA